MGVNNNNGPTVVAGSEAIVDSTAIEINPIGAKAENSGRRSRVTAVVPPLSLGNLQEVESLSPQRLESLYSVHVRGRLNALWTVASVNSTDKFASKDGMSVSGLKVMSSASGAVPIVGGAASAGFDFMALAAKKLEDNQDRDLNDKIIDLNPALDTHDWNDFTKDLARKLAKDRALELRSMGRKDISTLAGMDVDRIIEGMMITKDLPTLDEDMTETVGKLRSVVLKEKESPAVTRESSVDSLDSRPAELVKKHLLRSHQAC